MGGAAHGDDASRADVSSQTLLRPIYPCRLTHHGGNSVDQELTPLTGDERLFRLLDHYRSAAPEDRSAWLDRVMAREGGTDADLTRLHGALLAAAWVELNAGATAGVAAGRVPACYRVTAAGRQALKRAMASRFGVEDDAS
jgi:hypothetical protein